jgi:hypothetical protein
MSLNSVTGYTLGLGRVPGDSSVPTKSVGAKNFLSTEFCITEIDF